MSILPNDVKGMTAKVRVGINVDDSSVTKTGEDCDPKGASADRRHSNSDVQHDHLGTNERACIVAEGTVFKQEEVASVQAMDRDRIKELGKSCLDGAAGVNRSQIRPSGTGQKQLGLDYESEMSVDGYDDEPDPINEIKHQLNVVERQKLDEQREKEAALEKLSQAQERIRHLQTDLDNMTNRAKTAEEQLKKGADAFYEDVCQRLDERQERLRESLSDDRRKESEKLSIQLEELRGIDASARDGVREATNQLECQISMKVGEAVKALNEAKNGLIGDLDEWLRGLNAKNLKNLARFVQYFYLHIRELAVLADKYPELNDLRDVYSKINVAALILENACNSLGATYKWAKEGELYKKNEHQLKGSKESDSEGKKLLIKCCVAPGVYVEVSGGAYMPLINPAVQVIQADD